MRITIHGLPTPKRPETKQERIDRLWRELHNGENPKPPKARGTKQERIDRMMSKLQRKQRKPSKKGYRR